MELNNNKKGRLADFYKGRSVFITGGTGFMGKVLIEKLLYSCSDVKNVFVLIRPKRGKTARNRIYEMFKLPLFKRIREEKPHVFKKVIPVEGNVMLSGLGLHEEDSRQLIDEVSVLFHGAATLKLESNLKDAVMMNTRGTWNVLELAKEMKNLDDLPYYLIIALSICFYGVLTSFALTMPLKSYCPLERLTKRKDNYALDVPGHTCIPIGDLYYIEVFVHLSTAFCHVDHAVLEEKAYECSYDPQQIMTLSQLLDNKLLDKITFEMIAPHPNTYTFTKRLAERLVIEEYPNLPVCIARPSIVCPAFKEPLPGWVDSLNGPVGIMVAAGKGVLRSMYCKREYNAELIPVDFAINGLLAVARKVALEKKSKQIQVFNMTQSEERTASWGKILEMGKKFALEVPFDVVLWFPDGNIRNSLWVHKFYAFFLHWLPAYFIDFLLFIFCQKRFMIRVQKKIEVGLEVLQYFTTHKWIFKNENFLQVRDSMCPEDKEEFNIDFKAVEDMPYLRNCILGAREYCLKEPPENLPKARRMIRVMYVIDRVFRLLFILFMAHMMISCMSSATWIFDITEKHLKNVHFFRSFAPHEDMPNQRHM